MSDTKSSATESRKPAATDSCSGGEPITPGVSTARNAVSDRMGAGGDVLGATVGVIADVGEDVVHGVGHVALTAANETSNVLRGIAGRLRDVLSAGISGRRRESEKEPATSPH